MCIPAAELAAGDLQDTEVESLGEEVSFEFTLIFSNIMFSVMIKQNGCLFKIKYIIFLFKKDVCDVKL